jgi:hypothetical protein
MYVSVPEDMQGGQLEILGDRETAYKKTVEVDGEEQPVQPDAIETIVPKHNLHAEFRGDSYHRVRGYATDTSTLRVSLVLEQYKLNKKDEKFLTPYKESEKNGMTMM